MWFCIIRLLPCAIISAERTFPIIKSCIIDIEHCGLSVQVIATGNYLLNVNRFEMFSPNNKLEIKVPHPFDKHRIVFLTFHFVHTLKSIRKNWLDQHIHCLAISICTDPNFHYISSHLSAYYRKYTLNEVSIR